MSAGARRLAIIQKSVAILHGIHEECGTLPCTVSRTALTEFVDLCRVVCFPQYTRLPRDFPSPDRHADMQLVLDRIARIIHEQLLSGLKLRQYDERLEVANNPKLRDLQPRPYRTDEELDRHAWEMVETFMTEGLPTVRNLLLTDVEAMMTNDVAAESISEIVLCYPGLLCMTHQRIAHSLFRLGAPSNVTRMLTEIAHSLTGIDIHPHTRIGHHFFVDHGNGIVIGQTAEIGNHVSIFQGVTLGARSFPVDESGRRVRNLPRHPIIEDHVTIYSNAVVLGRVRIGKGSTIAGNAFVVRDVPPNSVVKGLTAPVIRNAKADVLFHEMGSGI